MKKLKSLLTILLALALTLALFSGCGKSGSTGTTGTPVTVSMALLSFNKIPDDVSKINKAVNDYIAKTYPNANVQLDLKLYGIADYGSKVQLAMQGGTPIDIFMPLQLSSAIAQNQCADISAYLEKDGKEMTAILKKDFSSDPYAILTKEGHIYGVPINKAVVLTPTFIYDKDMLAATGMSLDNVKSIFDLDPIFAKIKELYPDVYPYTAINPNATALAFIMFGAEKVDPLGDSPFNGMFTGSVIGNSNKVVNFYESEEFRKYADLMHSWYVKGYMPQDISTANAPASDYFKSGRLFSTFGGYADATGGTSIGKMLSTQTSRNVDGKTIGTFYMDTTASSLSMCVSSGSKNVEAAVKFLNILYTDTFVTNTILYGIEGEDYVKVSDHVVNYPKGLDANTVPYTAALTNGVMGSMSLMWNMSSEEDYQNGLKAIAQNTTAERSPYYGFVFDPTNVLNEMTAIQNVVQQYYPGLECGSSDPAVEIPKFVQALKDAGIDKVIAEKQTQLDVWLKATGK